ncbi:MAG: class I adenylate-forming enzyme family protein [Planctomycetota bacterium]
MLVDDLLASSAERYPAKTAVVEDGRRTTYAELDEAANRLAHLLGDSGLAPGDRVAVLLENSVESAISVFGVLRAGAAFVVINPTTKPDKLVFMLNDCAASALVVDARFAEAAAAASRDVASLKCIAAWGGDAGPGPERRADLDRELAGFPSARPRRRCIDMDLAAIIYTSGSTGHPKGVTVTHLNVISAATSITQYLEMAAEDVVINCLPLAFDYGLYQLLMSVKTGGTLVLERSFAYPYRIVELVRDEKVTGFPGVPTIFAMLLQMKGLGAEAFDGVRFVTNTAAALPAAHILRLRELFRNARIYSMYGITECKRVSYLPPEELDRRPTSVGRGMPNEQVFVVDEHGNEVEPGVVGELVVRGSNVMKGYWNRPDETARTLRPGRYPWERVLHTGDLFMKDSEGFLYFVARKDDIIKSRGEKVSPREVEGVIYELPAVREAAVVGVPDAVLGQAIKAVIVTAEGRSLEAREVMAHCARRLENFMVPKHVEFRAELPKTATGKIRHGPLRNESGPAAGDAAGAAT